MSLSQWLNSPYFSFVLIVIALVLLIIAMLYLSWMERVKVDQRKAFKVTTKQETVYEFGPLEPEGWRTVICDERPLKFIKCSAVFSLNLTKKLIKIPSGVVLGHKLIIYSDDKSDSWTTDVIVRIERA